MEWIKLDGSRRVKWESLFSRAREVTRRWAEILGHAMGSKNSCSCAAAAVVAEGWFAMKTVAEVIGVSRSSLIERMRERPKKRIGRPPRPPLPDTATGVPTPCWLPVGSFRCV
jgi:hypothetical protein